MDEGRADPGAGNRRRHHVKYMLLIYQNPSAFEALSEEERNTVFGEVDQIVNELTESGEWLGGQGLADPSNTKTVKVRNGVPAVTDGPYLESKEHLVGYCLFECESVERATDIATRWPDARYWAVEVRPLMDAAGTEM
jgi:hypothetical protein